MRESDRGALAPRGLLSYETIREEAILVPPDGGAEAVPMSPRNYGLTFLALMSIALVPPASANEPTPLVDLGVPFEEGALRLTLGAARDDSRDTCMLRSDGSCVYYAYWNPFDTEYPLNEGLKHGLYAGYSLQARNTSIVEGALLVPLVGQLDPGNSFMRYTIVIDGACMQTSDAAVILCGEGTPRARLVGFSLCGDANQARVNYGGGPLECYILAIVRNPFP